MTQVRFTLGDADTLKQAAEILKGIQEQIRAALQTTERMPEGAYGALTVLADMHLKLMNWATMVETRGWEKILDGSKGRG
jgi:hypothetical protein